MAHKTLKDFSWRYGVKFLTVIAALGGSAVYAANRYTIGLDTQDIRCLDEWVYVIDTWNKPAAEEVSRDAYIAVRLTQEQTPKGAKWAPTTIFVKRAIATQPGDLVSVTTEGVHLSNGTDDWTHGDGLASAKALNLTDDQLVRDFALADGQLFLMGDNPLSYDGRYYGPVQEKQIVGTVVWAF